MRFKRQPVHGKGATPLLPPSKVLGPRAQEFIKAVIAHRCKEGVLPRSLRHEALIYRKFFSVTRKFPWELSTEDFDHFMKLGHKDGKVATVIAGLAKRMSEHMLSLHVPLEPDVRAQSGVRIEAHFAQRPNARKLPEADALHELVRIVFQETPRGHQDRIRFYAIRLLILTGLRINEVLMLPADCLRWETYTDIATGKPAGEVGGVSRALRLRYFAEKDDEGGPDVLVERYQWVPQRFQDLVADAVSAALKATESLRRMLRNNRGQSRRFKTTTGTELSVVDMLFLVLHNHRGDLPRAIPLDALIEVASQQSIYQALGVTRRKGRKTIFTKYGKAANREQMKLRPHSLRHLMNTELFRLNVPDTVITQHFGRQSVAQSYEYDHRTLAERLAFVRLPASAANLVEPGTAQEAVAKMVVGGFIPTSHIAKSFKAIQREHGDEEAFSYLCANSDGFHVTPYGFCINSFSVNPCARHLKCFDNCKHFVPSGIHEHQVSLERLRIRLEAMKEAAAARPVKSVGRKNQIASAERLIAGVTAALRAQPNELVFPHGDDHSSMGKDLFT